MEIREKSELKSIYIYIYIYIYVIGVISTLFDIVTDVVQALGRQKSSL